mgnify:CR=1 FL=1
MLDKDTQKLMTEEDWLLDLVRHPGWKVAKKKFSERIMSAGDVFQIESLKDLYARRHAIRLLYDWLQDVEGTAAQNEDHREVFKRLREEEIVRNFV